MVGAEVTELIQGFVIAMQLETTEEDLMHTVFPHPTLSEMMHESVLDAYGRVDAHLMGAGSLAISSIVTRSRHRRELLVAISDRAYCLTPTASIWER